MAMPTALEIARNATLKPISEIAEDIGIPYQTLINLYLRECAATGKRLSLQWRPGAVRNAA